MMPLDNIEILNSIGGLHYTSLNSLIESNIDNEDNEEPQLLNKSPYVDHANLIDTLKQKTDIFKCLSLNIQSLNAKI